jgi:hypothetical protein
VHGNAATWVRALSPAADRRGLRISGDRGLAQSLLDTLSDGSRTRGAEVERESAAAV